MSLKELLDMRVRMYRAKHLKPRKELINEIASRCANITWNFLKIVIFFKQSKDNQVVVYLGIKTFYETREYAFVHKLAYLGKSYLHLYPLKYPKETLDKIRKLAEEEGFRVIDANQRRDVYETEKDIEWKIHIVYDVPEK